MTVPSQAQVRPRSGLTWAGFALDLGIRLMAKRTAGGAFGMSWPRQAEAIPNPCLTWAGLAIDFGICLLAECTAC